MPNAKIRLSDKFDHFFRKNEGTGLYEFVVKTTGSVFTAGAYEQGSREFHEGIATLFLLWKH